MAARCTARPPPRPSGACWLTSALPARPKPGGKPTKGAHSLQGYRASSTDADTWCEFEEAVAVWQRQPEKFSGVGFVFAEADPYAGIDLDRCLDVDGNPKPWARPIVEKFSDTYMETSPSGNGLKICCRGQIPTNLPGGQVAVGSVELYSRSRYFPVTVPCFRGSPYHLHSHHAILLCLLAPLAPIVPIP